MKKTILVLAEDLHVVNYYYSKFLPNHDKSDYIVYFISTKSNSLWT